MTPTASKATTSSRAIIAIIKSGAAATSTAVTKPGVLTSSRAITKTAATSTAVIKPGAVTTSRVITKTAATSTAVIKPGAVTSSRMITKTASPPDVRRGSAPPVAPNLFWGCAPGTDFVLTIRAEPVPRAEPIFYSTRTAGRSPASHPAAEPNTNGSQCERFQRNRFALNFIGE